MDSNTPRLSLRTIEPTDYPELAELMDLVFLMWADHGHA